MSQNAGDKSRHTGLSDTFENSTSEEIAAGEVVVASGENQVAPADANGAGGRIAGVASDPIPAGGKGTVYLSGAIWALIDDAVEAGTQVGAPDSSGTDTPGVAVSGDEKEVLETATDTNGNYIGRIVVN